MINVFDLRKSFVAPNGERLEVLSGVTFAAEPGESIAITGPSGSGKSTLLHLLGGLEPADHGTITLAQSNGNRRQIGFVFQFHYLLPDLSALENVALPLRIARYNNNRAIEVAKSFLKELGLETRADYPVTHLSGGEQQRVAVARALVTQPKLLLADEPTGNLDSRTSIEVMEIFQRLNTEGDLTILLVTHERDMTEYAARVVSFLDGRVQSDVPVTHRRTASGELQSLAAEPISA